MKRFKNHQRPNYQFHKAVKKPVEIECYQMDEPFEVETMEGLMRGNKGDWLMIGVKGELYPCADEVFKQSYDLLNKDIS